MEEKKQKKQTVATIILIALCNILLIAGAVLFTMNYSADVKKRQAETMLNTFENNVETMKQLSEQYLDTQLSIAKGRATYVQNQNMSLDEAIEYVSIIEDFQVGETHIVDLDTFAAWSSYGVNGNHSIDIFKRFSQDDSMEMYVDIMHRIMNGEKCVLCMYHVRESDRSVVSVGTAVKLRQENGESKDYLFLRAILVSKLKEQWVFPSTFKTAEIGLITTKYDYVLPSYSMKSENFIEFIRFYNFSDNFYGADDALAPIKEQKSGLLTLYNSKRNKQLCYWYYSRLENYPSVDILGYLPVEDIVTDVENISIVFVVSGLLVLLILIDGAYILQINRRLKETAKMADVANQQKTRFLSTMSHDIRTPLNAVLGMAELAQNKIDDKDYVKECLRKISVSGNHLLTLINDVLEISRIESGQTAMTLIPFDVNAMVSSLESITRSQAIGHGLKFEIKADKLPDRILIGDKLRLTQIYLNLLNNAVKYTPAGGSVYMELREDILPDFPDKVTLVCVIKDTGVGMSDEFQKFMYEAFYRASDSRTDRIQGTGLGLSIVKRLVDLMDGTIVCESAVNMGTTFTVSIPLTIEEGTDKIQSSEVQSDSENKNDDLKGLRILIAEDNDINWEIISALLEEYGIFCERAQDGRECVDKLVAQIPGTYDLVLTDIQMPVMNGLEAARTIRSSERLDLQQMPIIAMTADAFAEDIQNCIDAGMNAHVTKPIEIDKVLSAIRLTLSRSNGFQK